MNFPVTWNNITNTISISLIFALSTGKYELAYVRKVWQVFTSSNQCCYVIWLLSQAVIFKEKVVTIWEKYIFCWTESVHLQYFCKVHTDDGKNTPQQQCWIKKGIQNSAEYRITDWDTNKIQKLVYCWNNPRFTLRRKKIKYKTLHTVWIMHEMQECKQPK